MKEIKWVLVKELTQCVCLSHILMTKFTPNQHSKFVYTVNFLYTLVKLLKTQWILVKYLT